jgi:hypothetical protein
MVLGITSLDLVRGLYNPSVFLLGLFRSTYDVHVSKSSEDGKGRELVTSGRQKNIQARDVF